MNQTIIQAVLWLATLGALVLFLQRRRRRKTNY
jgi:MYXO-CTERM domain-containing protein